MKMLLSLVVWFVVWEVAGRLKLSTIVPPFSAVIQAGVEIAPTQKFAHAALISLRSYGLGMAFALLVGIPLGIAMARVKSIGRILGMWVNIFVSAPISALVPILMAVVGIGETTVVVTVFLFAVFVITLDTQVGITHADRSLVEMARSFGATRTQLYSKVLLLSALPEILAGFRMGGVIAHDGGDREPAPERIAESPFKLLTQMVERRKCLETHTVFVRVEAIAQREPKVSFLHQ